MPQFLWFYTVALSFGGVVTYWQISVLLVIAGFAATFFFRTKTLTISAAVLALVAFIAGYIVIASAGCALVG